MPARPEDGGRVLIIGLDGAGLAVLEPLWARGAMPVLTGLRDRGVAVALHSTLPPFTAPAWTTFMTGKNPGKHGILHFLERRNGQVGRFLTSRDIQCATIWDLLTAHQRTVGVLNVPMTYPAWPVRGWMVSGMVTPPGATDGVYPDDLRPQLDGYRVDLPYFMGGREFEAEHVPRPGRLLRDLTALVEARSRTVARLLRGRPWDAAMVVFTETDRIGHYLWPYHDPRSRWGPAVEAFYRKLDAALGRLIAAAGAATVLVMSDHGMGPAAQRRVYLNDWLYQQGYLRLRDGPGRLRTPAGWARRMGLTRDLAVRLGSYLPPSFFRWARALGREDLALDETRHVAYFAPIYEFVGGIWLAARLTAEQRASEVVELRQRLAALRDPLTGRAIVDRIASREEVYHGPYLGDMPDLLVIFHPDYVGSHRLGNPALVMRRIEPGGTRLWGAHRSEGVLVAAGPAIAPGAVPDAPTLADLAPTILHLCGTPVPEDMDGRVLMEMLTPAIRNGRPVRREPPRPYLMSSRAAPARDLSAREEETLRERLRGLGYL